MSVTRLQLRDFRCYERGGAAARARAHRRRRPQRRRQDEPARGAVLRLHGPLVPDGQRARGRALRRGADAAGARGRGRARRATRSRSASSPARRSACSVDGAAVERLTDAAARPLVSVFLPDRLELVLGAPALRRAHLDQVVAALWPGRAGTRRAYARRARPAQRADRRDPRRPRRPRVAAGVGRRARPPRDRADARPRRGRRAPARRASSPTRRTSGSRARPSSPTGRARRRADAEALAAELAERVDGDVERGFTGHGPHRDDLAFRRAGRELRAYGSRGQQRLGLLALLLAERAELAAERGRAAADAARRRDVRARRGPARAARRGAARRRPVA